MENVDPFVKVLHKPTVTKEIYKVRGDYNTVDSNMKALIMSISYAAVFSMSDEEVII